MDRNDRAMLAMIARGLKGLLLEEHRQGDALGTLLKTIGRRTLSFRTERTFGQELHLKARRHPHKIFVDFGPERWTYAEMDARSGKLARALQEALPANGCVGIMGKNSPEWLDGFFATQKAGLTCVPINTGLKSEGLAYVLENSGVDLLLVDSDLVETVRPLRSKLPRLKHIICIERQSAAPPDTLGYEHFVTRAQGVIEGGIEPDPKAACLLMYTSGTTGHPKAVVYRYGSSQAKLMRLLAHMTLSHDDVYFTCLPLFHANALMVTTLLSLYAGARVVFSDRFSATHFWNEVRASGATVFNSIGSMISILMKQPPTSLDRTHKVTRMISAACPKEQWAPFQERFGVQLIETYGAVDGGGIATFNLGYGPPGSVGKPIPGTRYMLIGEDGNDVGIGRPGELAHYLGWKIDLSVEFHRNPEASREKCRDGWVYTGDLMTRDRNGYLTFVGRKTDSMRVRGENVSAFEIESAANRRPAVLESAAFGVASDLGEQDVMLVVVPAPGGTVDPAKLRAELAREIPKHALPRYIRVVESIPKTGTHRVIKQPLQEEGITPDTWDWGKVSTSKSHASSVAA
ncbi:MAG: AMP-binding protein [Nitrospirae bacterium]|nr:AMP-binding protein [Nitrospirota bacterium]